MNSYEQQPSVFGSAVTDSVDSMMRLPIKVTEGTVDAMMDGMRWMANGFRRPGESNSSTLSRMSSDGRMDATTYADTTRTATTSKSGSSGSGGGWMAKLTGSENNSSVDDQDLCGDDLKYVVWSIVFTKPGFETVLVPQHEELVNYPADANSYAAIKIAKFVESARNGRSEKPEGWHDRGYPGESAQASNGTRRPETAPAFAGNTASKPEGSNDKGWRIPPEDQRYITFLYRVERRLPRQEVEVTRVERVTIERGHTSQTAIA